jgi:hypothetical protein
MGVWERARVCVWERVVTDLQCQPGHTHKVRPPLPPPLLQSRNREGQALSGATTDR